MSFSIRPAVLADARAIAEIHVASWRATYAGLVEADFLAELSVAEREAAWTERLSPGRPEAWHGVQFMAHSDTGKPLGFASGGPERGAGERGEVYAIYLAPEERGRGVGRALFRATAVALGAGGLCVWVLETNTPARRFYERLGGVYGAGKTLRIGMDDHLTLRYDYAPEVVAGWASA